MSESAPFLGRGWSFPPTFSASRDSDCPGRTETVAGEEDIHQSLTILFNTALGERIVQPTYGCDLKSQVFQPMNASVLTFIEDMLRTGIIYHEPRIKTNFLTVKPEQHEGRLLIDINYTIRGTNTRFNFVYPFYLNETGQLP